MIEVNEEYLQQITSLKCHKSLKICHAKNLAQNFWNSSNPSSVWTMSKYKPIFWSYFPNLTLILGKKLIKTIKIRSKDGSALFLDPAKEFWKYSKEGFMF